MKLNKLFVCATVACASLIGNPSIAQVRIGQQSAPIEGAVLDLNADGPNAYSGGLRLPHIRITDKGMIPAKTLENPNGFTAFSVDVAENEELIGLMVYNLGGSGAITSGTYYWNGTEWQNVVTSGSEGVVVGGKSASTQRGFGKFVSGRRCVSLDDIGSGELENEENGIPQAGRTYTFEAMERADEFHFIIQDPDGVLAFDPTNSNKTNLAIGDKISTTLTFKNNLVNAGAIRTVSIYASYRKNHSEMEYIVPMIVSIQNTGRSCCHARVSASVSKEFMCANLGADESKDWNKTGNGDYYQWGQPRPAASANREIVQPWGSRYNSDYSWNESGSSGTDPCPNGWRVPTLAEWTGVIDNNTYYWRNTTEEKGVYYGENLFLPAAGNYSNNGAFQNQDVGHYWSSTNYGTGNARYLQNNISGTIAYPGTPNILRPTAMFVRCIADN